MYAAVDPATNRLLRVWLYPTRTHALTEILISELCESHLLDDATVLVDGAPWLQAPVIDMGSDSSMKPANRNNVEHVFKNSVERVFREIIRRTNQFPNCFSHDEAKIVEN